MKVVGALTTTVLAALAVVAAIEVVRAIPDIQRYLRIRSL